jgi:hypothetical protein
VRSARVACVVLVLSLRDPSARSGQRAGACPGHELNSGRACVAAGLQQRCQAHLLGFLGSGPCPCRAMNTDSQLDDDVVLEKCG